MAEIIHPEQQDTAPPPLSQSAPKTVSAIIKATEGAAPPPPKGVAAHQLPPQRGPPSPLPSSRLHPRPSCADNIARARELLAVPMPQDHNTEADAVNPNEPPPQGAEPARAAAVA